jgi:hypothetical protein
MIINFNETNYYKLVRKDGLFTIKLQAVYEGSTYDGTDISFILDTGAYLTVISRSTAIMCGFDKLPKMRATLFGFSGGIAADFVRIPGLRLLDRLHTDVPVLIPHDLYRINPDTGEKKQLLEVLGLNILGYYDFYVDSTSDRLYLKETQQPKFYNDILKSEQVFVVDD